MNRSAIRQFSLIKISSFFLLGLSFLLFSSACRTPEKEVETVIEVVEVTATPRPTIEPTATTTAVPENITATVAGDLANFDPAEPLVVHFNQPMVPNRRPLRFSPNVNGEFEWSNNNSTLTFIAAKGFSSRKYTITLPTTTTTATGQRLDERQQWTLIPQKMPEVSRRFPSGDTVTEHQPTITLRFSETMNEATLAKAISVEPAIPFR